MDTTGAYAALHGLTAPSHGLPCVTKPDDFFSTFGRGHTNRRPNDSRSASLSSQEHGLGISTAGSPTMSGWECDMRHYPLSPPGSATIPSKGWPPGFPSDFPPPVFTDLPAQTHALANFGQITPPSDEPDSILDEQLREADQAPGTNSGSSATSYQPRRRTVDTTSDDKEGQHSHPKRTRKYTPRHSKQASLDPNNPNDVRRSKFLERNRVAASKCRQKKKEWTQNLEDRARDLQKDNGQLQAWIESLNDELFYLRNQMTGHTDCSCTALQEFVKDPANQMTAASSSIAKGRPKFAADLRGESDISHVSADPSETASSKMEQVDDGALAALLTSSLDHDTSDVGIARRIRA